MICVWKIIVDWSTHQWIWFNNSLNTSESLDIKLKAGGNPALIPVGELRVNKSLQLSSWKGGGRLRVFHASNPQPDLSAYQSKWPGNFGSASTTDALRDFLKKKYCCCCGWCCCCCCKVNIRFPFTNKLTTKAPRTTPKIFFFLQEIS